MMPMTLRSQIEFECPESCWPSESSYVLVSVMSIDMGVPFYGDTISCQREVCWVVGITRPNLGVDPAFLVVRQGYHLGDVCQVPCYPRYGYAFRSSNHRVTGGRLA